MSVVYKVTRSEKVKDDTNVPMNWRDRVVVYLEGVLNLQLTSVDLINQNTLNITFTAD